MGVSPWKFIGMVCFYGINQENGVCQRGTLIDAEFQNKNYGTATIRASNEFAFWQLGMRRIELYTDTTILWRKSSS